MALALTDDLELGLQARLGRDTQRTEPWIASNST